MKQHLVSIALIALVVACLCLMAFSSELYTDLQHMKNEASSLQAELENLKTFQRVKVINDFWEQSDSRNALYGTIMFDNLEIVEKIEVSYIDIVFNNIKVEENTLTLDYAQNKAVTFCIYDKIPQTCQLEVYYTDGRSETILIKIGMG